MSIHIRMAEETGVDVEELFTFSLTITKSMLTKYLCNSRLPNLGCVKFDHGLLKNVLNSFELLFLGERGTDGVKVIYPYNLTSKKYGTFVSGMKFSLLANGVTLFYTNLLPGTEANSKRTDSYGMPTPDAFHWCMENVENDEQRPLNESTWPESANQLLVDVIIKHTKEPKFIVKSMDELPEFLPSPGAGYFEQISKYFLSDNLCDVFVRCGTESFPAHQFILCHCSPVFAKMFQIEMRESKEKCVDIKDSEPDIVRELLRFIYTGEVNNLIDKQLQMYTLGDIYMIENLKILCVRSLLQSTNAENALEMHCFGRKNEIPLVSQKAERIMLENKKEMVKSFDDFQTIFKGLPDPIAADLFKLLWNTP